MTISYTKMYLIQLFYEFIHSLACFCFIVTINACKLYFNYYPSIIMFPEQPTSHHTTNPNIPPLFHCFTNPALATRVMPTSSIAQDHTFHKQFLYGRLTIFGLCYTELGSNSSNRDLACIANFHTLLQYNKKTHLF